MIPEKIPQDFYSRTTEKRLEWWNVLLQSIVEEFKKITFGANKNKEMYVETGAVTVTKTLPNAGDNIGYEYTVVKTDSGAGKITVVGPINGVTSIDIEKQYCGLKIKSIAGIWTVTGTIGECEIQTIDTAIELVYKYFKTATATGDVLALTYSADLPRAGILSVTLRALASATNYYISYQVGDDSMLCYDSATELRIALAGGFSGGTYQLTIRYYI
jgi:hypothetical protein